MSDTRDYEVGYKKPPKHSQFKPGESGRSRTRDQNFREVNKLPRTLNELVREVARKPVKVKEGDTVRNAHLPTLMIERILKEALSGKHPRLIQVAFDLLKDAEAFGDRPMTDDELVRTLTREEINQIDEIRGLLSGYSELEDHSSTEPDR
ncbi:DUF5681 domain-containing protein [Caulobacter sp.]|uniref:DUF5681 domain-containing protein n=1 Tax=Caulobacter sp. TaxID=78 RepID=UPI003BAA607C